MSYSSPVQVRAALPENLTVSTIEDSGLSPGDKRPKFDVLTLSVAGYRDRGHLGTLRLQFLNQRLLGEWFYPDVYETYIAALKSDGTEVVSDRDTLSGYTRVWTARDFKSRLYVGWEDTRLASEQRRWIMK